MNYLRIWVEIEAIFFLIWIELIFNQGILFNAFHRTKFMKIVPNLIFFLVFFSLKDYYWINISKYNLCVQCTVHKFLHVERGFIRSLHLCMSTILTKISFPPISVAKRTSEKCRRKFRFNYIDHFANGKLWPDSIFTFEYANSRKSKHKTHWTAHLWQNGKYTRSTVAC